MKFGRIWPLLAALAVGLLAPAPAAGSEALKIVAGTSLIEDIVSDLTAGQAETLVLIPGSSCPGHEAFKAGDFVFAAGADLILIHAFQRDMNPVAELRAALKKSPEDSVALETRGSWLIPEIQKKAAEEIAAALGAKFPRRRADFARRLAARQLRIDRLGEESLAKLAPLRGRTVIAAEMQAEFVRWAGFDILASYGEMTPREAAEIIDQARGKVISGVVDNYQSGSDAGTPLALELKSPHVVLSNFPGSADEAPDYFSLLRFNVERLAGLAG